MARPVRIEYFGAVYHITSRTNAGSVLFADESDHQMFLDILRKVVHQFNWICYAYCLMNDHYHLIVETPKANLSKGMRQLNGLYVQFFNKKYKIDGSLFRSRYKAVLIQKNDCLLQACRHVVLNPVRIRAVEYPEQWKWSSYSFTCGREKAPDFLSSEWILIQLDARREEAQKKYRWYVLKGLGEECLWKRVRCQTSPALKILN